MHGLTTETNAFISELAGRYQISDGAVLAMLTAVKRGHGTMAQFDIRELGGNGQWMRGGMTMVGDMFNHGLKHTVDNLCNALAQALASGRIDLPDEVSGQSSWWPQWLGVPSSTGAQNDSAYAVFPSQHCLAIRDATGITLYDTQDHLINGVGQQQGASGSLVFSSQRGSFAVSSLRRLDRSEDRSTPAQSATSDQGQGEGPRWMTSDTQTGVAEHAPEAAQSMPAAPSSSVSLPSSSGLSSVEARLVDAAETTHRPNPSAAPSSGSQATSAGHDIVALIEKLAALRTAGILTEDEFSAKKAELLARL